MRAVVFAWLVACGSKTPAAVEIPLPQADARSEYAIHLSHADHVGERERVVIEADEEHTTTTTRSGEELSSDHEKKRARMDAVATLLAIDENRESSSVRYDLKELTFTNAARERIHLVKGELEVTRTLKEDDAVIKLDGRDATDDLRTAMKLLMTLRRGGPTDDELIGTKAPQKIGAHWRIDEKRALEDLAVDVGKTMVEGAGISGDAWLAGVERVRGVECLDVRATMHIDGLDLSEHVQGAVDHARVTATFGGKFPVDARLGRLSDDLVIQMSFKLHTPSPSGDVGVSMIEVEHRHGDYTPLGSPVTPAGDASR
jgi:hypothetical protein